jgi:tetratricopeptide (TPR) repeat protein
MSTRLNGKLVAWVVGSALVLAGGVHLLHGFQSRRGARDLLPLADAAEQRGDPSEAARFLGNYLTLVPDDVDARARCAELLARLPAPAARDRALEMFGGVLRRQPGRDDVRRRLVRVALDLGRYGDAEAQLAALRKAAPDDGELDYAEGRCREARRELSRAAESYARAVERDPHQTDAYVRRARLLRQRLNRPGEADRVMDRLVTANGESFRAYLGRGRYRQEVGALDEAARDLARAEELAPRDLDVLLAAAELARARGDDAGARRRLLRCRELFPRDLRLIRDLGDLEAGAGRRPLAIAYLQQGLELYPDQPDLLRAVAELLLEEYDLAGSSAVIGRLNQVGCPVEEVQYLQARLLLLQGRWAEAARLLEWVRARAPAADLLGQVELTLGHCYDQLDDPERQLATYRRAAARDPLSPALRLALAAALAAQGRADEAAGEYVEAMALPGAPASGWLGLARVLVQRNLARPADRRRWGEVERVLERAERAAPGSPEVTLLRADVRLAQGRVAEARAVLAGAADRPEAAVALADLAAAEGRWEEGLRTLDDAGRRFGDGVELRLARARYWARRGTAEAPARLGEAVRGWEGLAFADQVRLLRGRRQPGGRPHPGAAGRAAAVRPARAAAAVRPGRAGGGRRGGAALVGRDPADRGGGRPALAVRRGGAGAGAGAARRPGRPGGSTATAGRGRGASADLGAGAAAGGRGRRGGGEAAGGRGRLPAGHPAGRDGPGGGAAGGAAAVGAGPRRRGPAAARPAAEVGRAGPDTRTGCGCRIAFRPGPGPEKRTLSPEVVLPLCLGNIHFSTPFTPPLGETKRSPRSKPPKKAIRSPTGCAHLAPPPICPGTLFTISLPRVSRGRVRTRGSCPSWR